MIRRHYLVEIKRVKELLLSTLSPPHHGSTPANHLSIRRNHGSPVASTRVLQHIPPQSGQSADMLACPLCANTGHYRINRSAHFADGEAVTLKRCHCKRTMDCSTAQVADLSKC